MCSQDQPPLPHFLQNFEKGGRGVSGKMSTSGYFLRVPGGYLSGGRSFKC